MRAGSWHNILELERLLEDDMDGFNAFLAAQDAHWRNLGDHVPSFPTWIRSRWGMVRVTLGWNEVVVYEVSGQYCGAFRLEGGRWRDVESDFSWSPE